MASHYNGFSKGSISQDFFNYTMCRTPRNSGHLTYCTVQTISLVFTMLMQCLYGFSQKWIFKVVHILETLYIFSIIMCLRPGLGIFKLTKIKKTFDTDLPYGGKLWYSKKLGNLANDQKFAKVSPPKYLLHLIASCDKLNGMIMLILNYFKQCP